MPIKDKRAGLVGELEETAFFADFVQSVFFPFRSLESQLEFAPYNNCWPFTSSREIKGGVDYRTGMMNSTTQEFFVFR